MTDLWMSSRRSVLRPKRSIRARLPFSVALSLALILRGTSAQADELERLQLSWTAPSDCPDSAAVRRRIAALMPSEVSVGADLDIVGSVTRGHGQFRLQLTLIEGGLREHRTFEATTCEDVVGAAAVAIALLLQSADTDGGSREGARSKPEGTTSEVQLAPSKSTNGPGSSRGKRSARSKSRRNPEGSAESARLRFALAAPVFHLQVGLLPRANVGLGAGAAVEGARWRMAFSGAWFADSKIESTTFADSGARLGRAQVEGSGCRLWTVGGLEIAPCLSASLEHLRAEGSGEGVTPQVSRATWVAVGPSGYMRFSFSRRVAFGASMGLLFQTSRPRLTIEGQEGDLGQVGLLNLTTSVGAEWFF